MGKYSEFQDKAAYLAAEDPFIMKNQADDAAHAKIKEWFSAALNAWTTSQADSGAAFDTVEALRAARRGQHLI